MDLKIHFSDPSEKHRDTQGVRKWVGAREGGNEVTMGGKGVKICRGHCWVQKE